MLFSNVHSLCTYHMYPHTWRPPFTIFRVLGKYVERFDLWWQHCSESEHQDLITHCCSIIFPEWNPQLHWCRNLGNHIWNNFNFMHDYRASSLPIFQTMNYKKIPISYLCLCYFLHTCFTYCTSCPSSPQSTTFLNIKDLPNSVIHFISARHHLLTS
jgi:hypothetical protein